MLLRFKQCRMLLSGVLLLAGVQLAGAQEPPEPATAQQLLSTLASASFGEKTVAVDALVEAGEARVAPALTALLDGNLYFRRDDGLVVIVRGNDILDPLEGTHLIGIEKDSLRKVLINNQLRVALRSGIARLELKSPDEAVRLRALVEMMNQPSVDAIAAIRAIRASEPDEDVIEAMDTVLALSDLADTDPARRLAAIERLSGNMHPVVKSRLVRLISEAAPRSAEQVAARKALERIESRLKIYQFIETTFFGLSLGSVLLLIAIGLAITFGVMGVINMAHGELMMLGAYTTYVVQLLMPNHIGLSLLVAVPAAFIVAGLVGIAIERGVIRFLYGRPLETLLATFGISLILQQLVRSVFSPLNRSVETPAWMSGSWEVVTGLSLTYNRLYIIVFSLLVFAALLLILKRTRLGLQVRAVAQNRSMAKAMGIRSEWVDALTFGLGSGIAGVAGVALSQLTNVGPNLGQAYIIDSFMVVVFGGVGNLWGTLVAALSLGVINKYLEPWTGAVVAKILVLVFIILFIQKRPRGLFPQRGRAAEG